MAPTPVAEKGQVGEAFAGEHTLDRAFDDVAATSGFTATHHSIDIYGRCAACGGAEPGDRAARAR